MVDLGVAIIITTSTVTTEDGLSKEYAEIFPLIQNSNVLNVDDDTAYKHYKAVEIISNRHGALPCCPLCTLSVPWSLICEHLALRVKRRQYLMDLKEFNLCSQLSSVEPQFKKTKLNEYHEEKRSNCCSNPNQ